MKVQRMGKGLTAICALVTLTCCSPDTDSKMQPSPEQVGEARKLASALRERLNEQLVDALETDGPIGAIDVCALAAPAIADEISDESGMTVGRTALRLRNPNNRPDAWEQTKLVEFQAAFAGGADPGSVEAAEIIDSATGHQFRWMKAIPLGGECTVCHGTDVDSNLLTAIQARYPEDAAVGFEMGELRGAFTVKAPVSSSTPSE